MPGQPIEIILMRELADHLATPIFVVDPDGDLLFYNEPAEKLLGTPLRRDRRDAVRGVVDDVHADRRATATPIPPTSCRWRSRCAEQRPAQGTCGSAGSTATGARLDRHRDPARRAVGRTPRRRRDLLGAASEGHDLGHAGLAGRARARDGPLRRQHVVRRGASDARRPCSCSTPAPASAGWATRLPPDVRRVDILLTHLHMDHIQGLGFFAPLFRPGFEVHIWGPGSATADLREPPHAVHVAAAVPRAAARAAVRPARPRRPRAAFEVPGVDVQRRARLPPRPDRRLPARDGTGGPLAYLPDHEPALACRRLRRVGPEWCSGFDLAGGVDLLIHDAQYTDAEYDARVGWGHSTSTTRSRSRALAQRQAASCRSTTTPRTTTTCSTTSSATHR